MTVNLCGMRVGRLTVIEPTRERSGRSIVWRCRCRCGNENALIAARDLLHSKRRGCGACADSKHPLYGIWRGVLTRCLNKDNPSYKHYGGRGITVCKEWQEDFLQFVEDVGPRTSIYFSLDRIDVNGNYEPNNVRWADAQQQATNKQPLVQGMEDSIIIDIFSSKETIATTAKTYGVSEKTVMNIRALCYSPRATDVCSKFILGRVNSKQLIK